jgi:orotidine-5'-phosphate decarboxylase
MKGDRLLELIVRRKSFLCIGLDSDIDKIPPHLRSEADPIFSFNKEIIDATRDLCVAYKPNTAFYEAMGSSGWKSLERTVAYIGSDHLKIADAKRADIGNSSRMYAEAFFGIMSFDAVTVSPYMGRDSIAPFLEYDDKWVIILALTSNEGSTDFQYLEVGPRKLHEEVLCRAMRWGSEDQVMFVVGATHPRELANLRKLAPDYWFLVPGVGTQGGQLDQVCRNGVNRRLGLLLNSSRGIIYAGSGKDFAEKAQRAAMSLRDQMLTFVSAIDR